jgi:hypothetical protein
MDSYHRANYGQNEPVNKAILIFNQYCGFVGFRDDFFIDFLDDSGFFITTNMELRFKGSTGRQNKKNKI